MTYLNTRCTSLSIYLSFLQQYSVTYNEFRGLTMRYSLDNGTKSDNETQPNNETRPHNETKPDNERRSEREIRPDNEQ